MEYVRIISFFLLFLGFFLVIFIGLLSCKNNNKPKKKNDKNKFCILIPARFESRVIENLLISIKNQTYKINMKDVYVIVESESDETVNICKKYKATVFVRKRLDLRRKGYALDEAVKYILSKNKKYDAYFIFDADNILDNKYFENMIPIYEKGYDLACGYRNCKNGNDSVIAAASTLTFSLVNTVFNSVKNKKTRNITFSGTGFYIRGYILNNLKGFPFNELTEDYEISMYATLNNLTTYYNTKSVFYDEQPVRFNDTINQRKRWIRGYFDVRKKYVPKIYKNLNFKDCNFGSKIDEVFGVTPYIIMLVGINIWLIGVISNIFYNMYLGLNINNYIKELGFILLMFYLALFIMTFVVLILERKNLKLNFKTKFKVLFYNPIFMLSYVDCAIRALTQETVEWTVVEHGDK